MPRRHTLTERQRRTLLALPTDEPSLLKHYTLAEDDLEHIRHRRRPPHPFVRFATEPIFATEPSELTDQFIDEYLRVNADACGS